MSEFVKRAISGAVYVAIVVGLLIWWPQYFMNVAGALAMLAVFEFHRLMGSSRRTTLFAGFAAAFLPVSMTLASAVLVGIMLIEELWHKAEDPIRNWGNILIGQFMIGLPFALMADICAKSNLLMLAIFVIIWTNDSMAYCTGSLLSKRKGGNHKMFPRVSPGKSWEGLIGGICFALLAGYGFSFVEPEFNVCQWLVLAGVIAVAGTLGDLMESLMKRTIGVKDSGRFMPGHGGVLDRFDSILLAAPVVWVVLQLI